MKDILKYTGLLIVGLFIAIIVYPFLHESGHSAVALLSGAKVVDFNLFPLPYVSCEISMVNKFNLIQIGLAGMYFPMIFSLIIRPKSFWLWYGVLVTKGICVLSFLISFVSIILFVFGTVIPNEDIVQVIGLWREGIIILAIITILAIIITIRSIIKQKPLNRILKHFEVQ